MKFSKEEIALCKKIAEKDRKEINYGDWFYSLYGKPEVMLYDLSAIKNDYLNFAKEKNIIPLWQISDCLEFLREKGHVGIQLLGSASWILWANKERGGIYEILGEGKTSLEACLKAVLAIVEKS